MPTLVVGPNWVGDMIMAHSLVSQLKSARPEDPIDVIAPPWSLAIASRMAEVRETFPVPFARGRLDLRGRWRFSRDLAARQYQRAYVLPNSLKSALIPAMAGIPIRTGWRGEHRYGLLNDLRTLSTLDFPLMVDRYRALGYPKGIASADALPGPRFEPRLQIDAANQDRLLTRFALDSKPLVALCPGAEFGPAKQWPLPYFSTLASRLIEQGWHVVLFGSEKDRASCQRILEEIPDSMRDGVVNTAGQTTLVDAIDLMGAVRLCVSNDSGLMHVAAATARPLVALFGPSSPAHTPPLSGQAVVLTHPIDCQPCFKRHCPLGHHACLTELSVDRVWSAVKPLLESVV